MNIEWSSCILYYIIYWCGCCGSLANRVVASQILQIFFFMFKNFKFLFTYRGKVISSSHLHRYITLLLWWTDFPILQPALLLESHIRFHSVSLSYIRKTEVLDNCILGNFHSLRQNTASWFQYSQFCWQHLGNEQSLLWPYARSHSRTGDDRTSCTMCGTGTCY